VKAPTWSSRIVLVTVAALLIAMFGFLFGRSTASVDETLVRLVRDLSESAGTSTVFAASLMAASCILAALIVPVIVTLVAVHAERKEESHDRQCRTVYPDGLPRGQHHLDSDESVHGRLACPAGQLTGRRHADGRRGHPAPPAARKRRRKRRRPRRRRTRHRGPIRKG
jgi:hypothetical protein